jgi:serine/threonine protein kinase
MHTVKLLDIIVSKNFEDNLLFLVLEHHATSLHSKLLNVCGKNFNDTHVATILYNILCVINFIHSANILHRDLRPCNFSIDENFKVTLNNFGRSRTQPIFKVNSFIQQIGLASMDKKQLGKLPEIKPYYTTPQNQSTKIAKIEEPLKMDMKAAFQKGINIKVK